MREKSLGYMAALDENFASITMKFYYLCSSQYIAALLRVMLAVNAKLELFYMTYMYLKTPSLLTSLREE